VQVPKVFIEWLSKLLNHVTGLFSDKLAITNRGFDYLHEESCEGFDTNTKEYREGGDINAPEWNCGQTVLEFDWLRLSFT